MTIRVTNSARTGIDARYGRLGSRRLKPPPQFYTGQDQCSLSERATDVEVGATGIRHDTTGHETTRTCAATGDSLLVHREGKQLLATPTCLVGPWKRRGAGSGIRPLSRSAPIHPCCTYTSTIRVMYSYYKEYTRTGILFSSG